MISTTRIRRSVAGWLLALGALACTIGLPAVPAQGYTVLTPPWYICAGDGEADLSVLEASLSPANAATVTAGSPVTFSGNSPVPLTFAVASSSALLSTPNVDMSPSTYTFTSTKATATPGTVYWDASFSTATIAACEGLTPTTYTTVARTLTVLPSPAEEAAAVKKKQEEEAAAATRKRQEEEAAVVSTGSVTLEDSTIVVQSNGDAQVKLTCTGTGPCSGKLSLTGKVPLEKSRQTKVQTKTKAKPETMGTAAFSIPPGQDGHHRPRAQRGRTPVTERRSRTSRRHPDDPEVLTIPVADTHGERQALCARRLPGETRSHEPIFRVGGYGPLMRISGCCVLRYTLQCVDDRADGSLRPRWRRLERGQGIYAAGACGEAVRGSHARASCAETR